MREAPVVTFIGPFFLLPHRALNMHIASPTASKYKQLQHTCAVCVTFLTAVISLKSGVVAADGGGGRLAQQASIRWAGGPANAHRAHLECLSWHVELPHQLQVYFLCLGHSLSPYIFFRAMSSDSAVAHSKGPLWL